LESFCVKFGAKSIAPLVHIFHTFLNVLSLSGKTKDGRSGHFSRLLGSAVHGGVMTLWHLEVFGFGAALLLKLLGDGMRGLSVLI
jgi:hypothetical protein